MTNSPTSAARPILASSLLSRELNQWDPQNRHHWQTGLPSLDNYFPASLWTGGKVIGIVDDSNNESEDAFQGDQSAPLITNLIITHLSQPQHNTTNKDKSASSPSTSTSPPLPPAPSLDPVIAAIYIISPVYPTSLSTSTSPSNSPSSGPLSPSSLASSLESASLPPSLLDSISLLQYFDFPGLADAVAEVSHALFFNHNNNNNDSKPHHRHHHASSNSQAHQKSILIISGLHSTLASLHLRSGALATNALLAPLVRSLTLLSRNHPHVLVLLLLEPDFLDCLSTGSAAGAGAGQGISTFSSCTTTTTSTSASTTTKSEKRGGRGAGRGGSSSKSLAPVTGLLAGGLDTLILLHQHPHSNPAKGHHQGEETTIVEVLLDRTGEATGHWAIIR